MKRNMNLTIAERIGSLRVWLAFTTMALAVVALGNIAAAAFPAEAPGPAAITPCDVPNFADAANFGVGSSPNSVAVGDFNGDGDLDMATANVYSNDVSVLLGDGAGGFGLAGSYSVGYDPQSVVASDFNNDGSTDLATSNIFSDDVSVLLGDGFGSFGTATNFGVGSHPYSVAVSDFNNDGDPDLATATSIPAMCRC
jgi:hypothetical protein